MRTSFVLSFLLLVAFVGVVWSLLRGFKHYDRYNRRCDYCWGWTVTYAVFGAFVFILAYHYLQLGD